MITVKPQTGPLRATGGQLNNLVADALEALATEVNSKGTGSDSATSGNNITIINNTNPSEGEADLVEITDSAYEFTLAEDAQSTELNLYVEWAAPESFNSDGYGVIALVKYPNNGDAASLQGFPLDGSQQLFTDSDIKTAPRFYVDRSQSSQQLVISGLTPPTAQAKAKVWLVSFSPNHTNAFTDGTTPSVEITVDPMTLGPAGEEYCRNVTNFGVTAEDSTTGGSLKTRLTVTFTPPPSDPDWIGIALFADITGFSRRRLTSSILRHSPATVEIDTPGSGSGIAKFWAPSASNVGLNTIVDGKTPTATATIGTSTGTINVNQFNGLITANQIGSVNAGTINGTITAEHIGSVNANTINGLIQANQIGAVNATQINGLIAASQIDKINASQINGSIDASQIGSINASSILGSISSSQIGSVSASSIQGSISASSIASVNATSIVGSIQAGQIASLTAAQITGVIVTSQLVDQILSTQRLLSTDLRIVKRVSSLPTLPSSDYPVGSAVLLTTNKTIYVAQSDGIWKASSAADEITGTLTAYDIGSVNASAINGLIIASQIQSVNASAINGQITSTQIASVSATSISGTITSSQIDKLNATQINGQLTATQIAAVNAGSITGSIIATQIASVNATAITGAIKANQIESVNATAISGAITASQISTVNATSIQGSITASSISSVNATSIVGAIAATSITAINATNVTLTGLWQDGQIAGINASKLTAGTITATIRITSPDIVATGSGFVASLNSTQGVLVDSAGNGFVQLKSDAVYVGGNGSWSSYVSTFRSWVWGMTNGRFTAQLTIGDFGFLSHYVGLDLTPPGGSPLYVRADTDGNYVKTSQNNSFVIFDGTNCYADFSAGYKVSGYTVIDANRHHRFASGDVNSEAIALSGITTSHCIYAYDQSGNYLGKIPVFL